MQKAWVYSQAFYGLHYLRAVCGNHGHESGALQQPRIYANRINRCISDCRGNFCGGRWEVYVAGPTRTASGAGSNTAMCGARSSWPCPRRGLCVLLSGTTLDVRKDTNNDGVFASSESVVLGPVTYPITLAQGG